MEAKDLEGTLRMEYRSKLLNPKWAQAMAAQGAFWDGNVDVGCLYVCVGRILDGPPLITQTPYPSLPPTTKTITKQAPVAPTRSRNA